MSAHSHPTQLTQQQQQGLNLFRMSTTNWSLDRLACEDDDGGCCHLDRPMKVFSLKGLLLGWMVRTLLHPNGWVWLWLHRSIDCINYRKCI